MLTHDDLWHAGYGAGLSGLGWVDVVGGRSLTAAERRVLAAGWRCGCRDIDAYRRDLAMTTGEPLPW